MVKTLPVAELSRQLRSGAHLRLIDVRSPAEYAAGHARGAVSMPLDALDPRAVAELPGSGPIYVICRSGVRSERACQQLVDQCLGTEVVSVSGGTEAWAQAGLPMERPGATPTAVPKAQAETACSGGACGNSGAKTNSASGAASPAPTAAELDAAIASRVRLIAGSLVLLGVALGHFVDPRLHFLSAIPGLGLVHAGLSGQCLMATFLGRLGGRAA